MAELPDILSDEEIATLHRGYDLTALNGGARMGLVTATFGGAAGLVDPLQARFYPEKRSRNNFFGNKVRRAAARAQKAPAPLAMDNAARELILISVLGRQGNAYFLAIHIYWGLMEGLSVTAIANALLLTSWYEGISLWSAQSGTLRTTLDLLKQQVADGKTGTNDVVGALKAALA